MAKPGGEIAGLIAEVLPDHSLYAVARAAGMHPSHLSDVVVGRCVATRATVARIRLAVARLKSGAADGSLQSALVFKVLLVLACVQLGIDPADVKAQGPARKASERPEWMQAAKARRLAQYVMNVSLGFAQAEVARASGVTRQAVSLAARNVENLRENQDTEQLLARLEVWLA